MDGSSVRVSSGAQLRHLVRRSTCSRCRGGQREQWSGDGHGCDCWMAPRCFLRRDRSNGREVVIENLVKLKERLVGRAIRNLPI
jgi:hypothetical protein